jgi:hypothetical protein
MGNENKSRWALAALAAMFVALFTYLTIKQGAQIWSWTTGLFRWLGVAAVVAMIAAVFAYSIIKSSWIARLFRWSGWQWPGWNALAAIAAMVAALFTYLTIKQGAQIWRDERRSERPYFAISDKRTATRIMDGPNVLGHDFEFCVKNIGSRTAMSLCGVRMFVDADLSTATWSRLIQITRKRPLKKSDLAVDGITTESFNIHPFAIYGHIESGGTFVYDETSRGAKVKDKYIAMMVRYSDALSGEHFEQQFMVWKLRGFRATATNYDLTYPERSEPALQYINQMLTLSMPSP